MDRDYTKLLSILGLYFQIRDDYANLRSDEVCCECIYVCMYVCMYVYTYAYVRKECVYVFAHTFVLVYTYVYGHPCK